MKELLEFAGAHPWPAVVCLMVILHAPIALIQALKTPNTPKAPKAPKAPKDTDGN